MVMDRECTRCRRMTRQELCQKIAGNRAEHYAWWCLEGRWWCFSKKGGIWITKDTLTEFGVELEHLRTVEVAIGERCSRCGQRGAELHHWSPRAIFGKEADDWPKDYLCKTCHDEWHLKVTPQLVK